VFFFASARAEDSHPVFSFSQTNSQTITNWLDQDVFSNFTLTNTNIIFIFYDPFYPLANVDSPDELHQAMAELIFPGNEIIFTNQEPKWSKKHRYASGIKLLTEEELWRYSDEVFQKYSSRRLTGRLDFTPEEKKHLNIGFEEWETKIVVSGWVNLRMGYGTSFKDENFLQNAGGIQQGFNLAQNMRMNIVGKIGDRVQVSINHSSDSPDNEYEIGYKALDTDAGLLRELRAGNISLNIPQSSYFLKYSGTSKDSYGLKATLRAGDLTSQTVLNLTKSKKGYKKFVGKKRLTNLEIPDVNYVKRRYFVVPDTSLDRGTVELLTSTADTNLADRRIDSHYFKRLVEGRDFFVNDGTGEINLGYTLSKDNDLLVKYTHGGASFTSNSNSIVGIDNNNGDQFLYLWQSTGNFSPYIHYGYYNLGIVNFDPAKGFSITVVYSSDKTKLAALQFNESDYLLTPRDGTVKFRKTLPFPDTLGKVYPNPDPPSSDSEYTMLVTVYDESPNYQLDFGIITGTERIYVNGRQLSPSEYTIVQSVGELYLNNPSLINENDTVEIYYEYKPFWAGSQKLSVANRLDWKPSNIFNLGNTLIYSVSQRDAGAPYISATPDGVFLGDIDGTLNIGKLFNLPDDFNVNVKGEAALSVYDPNTAGYAILDDFENVGSSFGFSKNENLWILCAPASNIDGIAYSNRGLLLYKDYRSYNFDGSYSLLNFPTLLSPDKIKAYSDKPGPYISLGGHLNSALYPSVEQSSLVFDFDFNNGGNWVGAAFSIAGPAGVDLSTYNEISFWAKVQDDENGDNVYEDGNNDSVEFFVAAGQMNEDSDGNGSLDAEASVAQPGYDFHNFANPSLVETHVGRGRLGAGDSYIQTEDLNRDGVLGTNDRVVVFPGKTGYTDISNVVVTEGDWKKYSINIQSLSADQISVLEHASSLSLYIRKKNGNKGRVILDSLDFKKVNWTEKQIDGIRADEAGVIEGDYVSVFNNPDYTANRFYSLESTDSNSQERAKIFEKLHGSKTISEANQYDEKSIALVYNLTNTPFDTNFSPPIGGESGFLVKRFSASIDISKYKNLDFYIFVPDQAENGSAIKNAGDTYTNENFVFSAGSSENSYYQWNIPLGLVSKNAWHHVRVNVFENYRLDLDGNPVAGNERPSITGVPNVHDVKYLKLGVRLSSTNETINHGIVWVNEMHVSSDVSVVGTAYYLNSVFEYKKPLLAINSFEIVGPVSIKSAFENRDANFISAEGEQGGAFNRNWNIDYSSSFLKDICYNISYNDNAQGTSTNTLDMPQYLQWDSKKNIFNYFLSYNAISKDYIPTINHSYTESFEARLSRNLANLSNNDYILGALDGQFNSTTKVEIRQNIPIFKGFTFFPRMSFEDSFYLIDHSNFTNEDNHGFLTNFFAYGTKELKKSLTAGMGLSVWVFNAGFDYSQSIDKFKKIYDVSGYRSEIESMKNKLVFERYSERVLSASKGFYFPEEDLDKANSESYLVSFSGDRPIPYFSFWINDKLGRNAGSYSYNTSNLLLSRIESYNLGNDSKLYLYPKFLILDTVQFKLKRDIDFNYSSIDPGLSYSNILLPFSSIYYSLPFTYSAFFNGDSGRTNSLALASEYFDPSYGSSLRFTDSFGIDLILMDFKDFFGTFIPKHYTFSTLLVTERNYSSFFQSLENQFGTSFPLKIREWLLPVVQQNEWINFADINISLTYKNTITYNDRKIADTLLGNASETISFSKFANLALNYSLAFTAESYLKKLENFEKNYGFIDSYTKPSPMRKYSHSGSVALNWVLNDIKELNFLLFSVNLRGSSINNREGLTISGDSINYDGSVFSRFYQKVIEGILEHSSEYSFTDYIKGILILKASLSQYAEVIPIGNSIQRNFFRPTFGFEAALDMRIQF
jgi:hypothetical protein